MISEEELFERERARFDRLCMEAVATEHVSGQAGIGTLAEKRLHAVIKRFLAADERYQEVGIPDTRYVADVRIGNHIFEVQTGDFAPMRDKIAYYLEHTDCAVTVVHPIPVKKWISWIDPKSGEISERARAPKKKPCDLLPQLYALLPMLGNPRLRFRLLLIEAHDFRMLSTRSKKPKSRAKKYERIPLSLIGIMDFDEAADFRALIPPDLPAHFTVKEFSKRSHLHGIDAYSAVRALVALGLFAEGERIGRSMGFIKTETA